MSAPGHEVVDLVTPPASPGPNIGPGDIVDLVTPPSSPEPNIGALSDEFQGPNVVDDVRASGGASSGGASSGRYGIGGGASSGGASSGGASSGGYGIGASSGASSGDIKYGKGPCGSSNKDNLLVEHFSFESGVGSDQERAESLRNSFGIPRNIVGVDEIKNKVNAVMTDVCTDIGPVYLTGAVDWAIDRNKAFQFNFLTSVKLKVNGEYQFVGFMTVNDDDASKSCDVTLLCAREGCGGFVYDHAEVEARRRGMTKVVLESVVDKYGFYRKKGFTSTTHKNKQLDVFWDRISSVSGIPGDDGSDDFFSGHFGRKRKLTGIWPTIKTYLHGYSEKNTVTANLTRKFTRSKLVNIVLKLFSGNAEQFFTEVPDVEVNASGTISMEKNI